MDKTRILFVKPGDKIKDCIWAIHHYAAVLSRDKRYAVYFATSNFRFHDTPDIQLFSNYPPLKRDPLIFISIVKRWLGFAKTLKTVQPDILFINNHIGAIDCLVLAAVMRMKTGKILDIRTLPDKKWKTAYYTCITPFFDFVFGLNDAILNKMVINKKSGQLPLGFDPKVFFRDKTNLVQLDHPQSDTRSSGTRPFLASHSNQRLPAAPQPDQTDQAGPAGFKARSSLYCIYFGSLDKKRKILNLVKAVEKSIEAGGVIQLTLVGSGNEESRINAYVNDKHLDTVIKLYGFMPQNRLRQIISNQHLGISYVPDTGMYQPQVPLKTVEMLACGIPVLATRTKGNQAIVKQGQNGYLTDDSVDDMAGTLTAIWEKGISSRLYQNSSESVKRMDWENIVANHLLPVLERVKHTL